MLTDPMTSISDRKRPREGGQLAATVPGKSWFIILRMYGPLEPWINKTWRPGEIELVE